MYEFGKEVNVSPDKILLLGPRGPYAANEIALAASHYNLVQVSARSF